MKQEDLSTLLLKIVEASKTNKNVLRKLKDASVHAQMYELASEFLDIEKSNFPRTQEQIDAELLASEINTLFRMADYNVEDSTCWVFYQLIKLHIKKKGKETISDVVSLKFKMNELFEKP